MQTKKIILITVFALAVVFSSFADAGKGYLTREYPWVMRSPAALAMGNAYHTKSDSKYAPFYNPAGLNRITRDWRFDLIPLGVIINDNIRSLGQDALDTDFGEEKELADLFKSHIGKPQFGAVSLYPGFTMKNFTIGIFGNAQLGAQIANPVLPELNGDIIGDAGVVAGLAHSFFDDRLQAGLALRFQRRWSFQQSYLFSDFIDETITDIDYMDEIGEGMGVFGDVGAIYNFWNDGCNPRAGLSVNNLGMNSLGDAADLPWSITLSFGVSPSISIIKTDIILDIVDITHNFEQDDDWGKRINMGLEFYFDVWAVRAFKLRAGVHQGYPSFGFGFDTNFVQVNFAHYKEELGAYAGQNADTRNALEVILSF
jgi:hypothetical protein